MISPGRVRSFPVPSSQRPCHRAVPEERWTVTAVIGVAPCQWSLPAGTRSRHLVECPQLDQPSVGPDQRLAKPGGSAMLPGRMCLSGCLEQGSRRMVPGKDSDGPFAEGCEPLLL